MEFVDGAPEGLSLVDDPYGTLPWSGPETPGVGHALITMVEPHKDRLREYNRWYEDYHFIDGAMQLPWMFSGRRFVATRELQGMRYPDDSTAVTPVTRGKYVSLYWITPQRLADHKAWTFATNARHRVEGNVSLARDHVFTSFQDYAGAVYRDVDVPEVRWALHDPPAGLVLQIVDATEPENRTALERWLLETHLSERVSQCGPTTTAAVFRTNPPSTGHSEAVYRSQLAVTNGGRRLTVAWFLDRDPREVWADHFADEIEGVARSAMGATTFISPFLPCRMGTDTYADDVFD